MDRPKRQRSDVSYTEAPPKGWPSLRTRRPAWAKEQGTSSRSSSREPKKGAPKKKASKSLSFSSKKDLKMDADDTPRSRTTLGSPRSRLTSRVGSPKSKVG